MNYGADPESINSGIAGVLASTSPDRWRELIISFTDRHVFDDTKPGGAKRAARFLEVLGANRLIHGHTPIDKVTGSKPTAVTGPYSYDDGLCINIDGGMYRGGPGFLYRTS